MTTTVLRPNAGTSFANLADDSDGTFVTVSAVDTWSLTTKTLATGEVTKTVTARARVGSSTNSTIRVVGVSTAITNSTGIVTVSGTKTAVSLDQAGVDALTFQVTPTPLDSDTFYELYVDLVTVARPVTTITAVTPDPFTATTVVPIAWVNTLDTDGGDQTRYQIIVTDDNDADAVVYDTGVVISGNVLHEVGPLSNGNYTAAVRAAQTVNGASTWSEYSTDSFEVDATISDISTLVGTAVDAAGRIDVVATRDGASEAWELIEIERSVDGGFAWSPVRTATIVDATGDADTFSVEDHEAPNGASVLYRARATYYSSSLPITAGWTVSAATGWTGEQCDDWLKAPYAPSLNVLTVGASWDAQPRSKRGGVFQVLGEPEPVTVTDVLSAASGAITIRTRGSAEALALDAILESPGPLLLNLNPESATGPARDGFQYIAVTGTSETWTTQRYRGDDRTFKMTTITFTRTAWPPDPTAGSV